MPGTFDSVLTVASAENEGVKWLNPTGVLGWYNKGMAADQYMSVSEIENVPEGKGFYENLRPTEDLVGGTYGYTESIKNSDGQIVYVPFEGGQRRLHYCGRQRPQAQPASCSTTRLPPRKQSGTMWMLS